MSILSLLKPLDETILSIIGDTVILTLQQKDSKHMDLSFFTGQTLTSGFSCLLIFPAPFISGISQPCLMTWEAILYDSVLANPLEIFPQKKIPIKCLVYLPFCLAFDSDPCPNKKVSLDFNIPSSLLSSWSTHFLIPPICLELQVVMS